LANIPPVIAYSCADLLCNKITVFAVLWQLVREKAQKKAAEAAFSR
jgi:hypothetical protein